MKPEALRTFTALVFALAWTTASDSAEPIRLRVLSYNIHHGEGVDRQLDLDRIARVVTSAKPDLVALQEVDQRVQRTNSVDQPARLAELTGLAIAFGANIDLQGGHYGNAVLSRHAIVATSNHSLPNVDQGEQRGLLAVEVKIPEAGKTLLLLATHLDHRRDDRERVESAKMINQLVAEQRGPVILAGDLNDVVGSETLRQLELDWQRANEQPLATIPVGEPSRQIDFILFRPAERWRVIEVKVLEEAVASDHRAILAVLELR